MDTSDLKIVCYAGGTCGDLITGMIDCRDVTYRDSVLVHNDFRQRLKKPNTFANNEEKDKYVTEVLIHYNSIPSHDLNYHIERKHPFISITVNDFDTASWAANRFKQLHRPHVWKEMQQACGANTVKDYAQILIDYSNLVKMHTNQLITLESIIQGHAVEQIENILKQNLDNAEKDLYNNWLQKQNIS